MKHDALAEEAGVPLVPGSPLLHSLDEAITAANKIGYPIMLKSSAGGGGIGMRVCQDEAELSAAFASVTQLASNNFGDASVFMERAIVHARHIEVQIIGDGNGHVIALGDRDCSVQRRNQKVIEEAPAPGLSAENRRALHESAVNLVQSVNYRSAGTVEYIYDSEHEEFFFLEVNSRLQVEHGVTELVTGVDLVEWMVRVAANEPTVCLNVARNSVAMPFRPGFTPRTPAMISVLPLA